MSARRRGSATVGHSDVKDGGDQSWPDAGRATVGALAKLVGRRSRAIDGAVGVDAVHDMRTATRRLRTAIELHADQAPKKRRGEVEDELRRVARRLGAVRDLDVLLETLDGASANSHPSPTNEVEPLREAWRTERASGARRLRAEIARPRFRRALRASKGLVPRRSPGSGDRDSGATARRDRVATQAPARIWEAFGAVLEHEVDPKTADPAQIHALRIAAKRLRYSLEAFQEALEPGATLIRDVTALQDAAGSMHDAIVAGDRARSTLDPRDLTGRERRAINTFADGQAREAERLRPAIARRLRTIRSHAFRESLGRAVAGMGHVRFVESP
jgi:CHAD domain-containing protein